ncbi:hypothetical protein ACLKA6_017027 [Drosophila palustris]
MTRRRRRRRRHVPPGQVLGGHLKMALPSQRPYPFGRTMTEVCSIAIPPELEPHVNEADDDDESKPRTKQADEPDLEPWVRKFLESEPAQCETLTGVTHITEHVITMKDDRPIKQRYYQKNPCNASLMTRSTNY